MTMAGDTKFTVKAGLPQAPRTMDVSVTAGELKPWDLDSLPEFREVGKRHPRLEGPQKVTGRAKYTRTCSFPGCSTAA